MPKETPFRKDLSDLVKANAENLALFVWVTAEKNLAPSIQVKDSILRFFAKFNISEDKWSLDSAHQIYYRFTEYGFKNPNND